MVCYYSTYFLEAVPRDTSAGILPSKIACGRVLHIYVDTNLTNASHWSTLTGDIVSYFRYKFNFCCAKFYSLVAFNILNHDCAVAYPEGSKLHKFIVY